MLYNSGQKAIVLCHDAETFFEGCLVVGSGHAFAQVVGKRLVHIDVPHAPTFALLHAADAPVEVGGKAVGQIVWKGDLAIDVEGLVTDEHSVFEGTPSEVFGRSETTVAKEGAVVVHDVGVAIEDSDGGAVGRCRNLCEGVLAVEFVASVEEAEEVAGGEFQGFVHGVVQPLVGFADDDGVVSLGNLHRLVLRCSVHDDVLDVRVCLLCHALQGAFDGRLSVVGDGDDANLHKPRCISWLRHFRCRW